MRTARAATDAWVRALRPPKVPVDPWRPIGALREEERWPGGGSAQVFTVLLAGRECPFACVFCDLWRRTLDRPTPPGAVPRQIEIALAEADAGAAAPDGGGPLRGIKLYNASNFFDPNAVPAADLAAVARLVARFERVVVECHPRLIGPSCERFSESLPGELEVAMGLETVHPRALARLNKGMTIRDFDRAAGRLTGAGVRLRAFVLVGAPFVPAAEAVDWAVRSAEHALDLGAQIVSLIPVRGGNGALESLAASGDFRPPDLAQLEEALDRCQALERGTVLADLWDVERLASGCPNCAAARVERLRRLNRSGEAEPRIACGACAP